MIPDINPMQRQDMGSSFSTLYRISISASAVVGELGAFVNIGLVVSEENLVSADEESGDRDSAVKGESEVKKAKLSSSGLASVPTTV